MYLKDYIQSASGQFITNLATGTAPLAVFSTTKVANLNVDRIDDLDSTDFMRIIKGSYSHYGMAGPGGDDTLWIRTTTRGILPHDQGPITSGHGVIGTAAWSFADIFSQRLHSQWTHVDRGCAGNDGGLTLYGADTKYMIALRNNLGTLINSNNTYGINEGFAMFLTMDNHANRGWIFKRGSINVAGITGYGTYLSAVDTGTYLAGNQGNVIIDSIRGANNYTMLFRQKSSNGVFTGGVYNGDWELHYTDDTTIANGTNAITHGIQLLDEVGITRLKRLYVASINSSNQNIDNISGYIFYTEGNAKITGTLTVPRVIGTADKAILATRLETPRTLTIGATGKTFDGSANVSWTPYEMRLTRALYNTDSNLNTFAQHGCALGMLNLTGTDATINPNAQTGWHHIFQATWCDCADNNGITNNDWCSQIAVKAGTDQWYVRSRDGGTIADGTAWKSNWRRLVTSGIAGTGSANQPVYVNNAGETVAIDWHVGNANLGEHNADNITYNMIGYYTTNGPHADSRWDPQLPYKNGGIYSQAYSTGWVTQMAQSYSYGELFIRSKRGYDGWQPWEKVIDTKNMTELFTSLYWTDGTTGGPTLNAVIGGTGRQATLPIATTSVSGVVTTGTQSFAGYKTLNADAQLNGTLRIYPQTGNYCEGMRIYPRGAWSIITLLGADSAGPAGITANSWFIGNNNGSFYLTRNGSSAPNPVQLACVNNIWHITGITRVQNPGMIFYLKSTVTNAYSSFHFGYQGNDDAALIFLNGPERADDGGPNLFTIRNNVGDLRLDDNVIIPGRLSVGGYNHTGYWLSTQSFICNDWVRTLNATGWYNETYGGGIWMNDSNWVRVFNGKGLFSNGNIRIEKDIPDINLYNSNPSTYSIIYLSNPNNSAYIWLNGASRTDDGGVNTLNIRNDAGDLRLHDNVIIQGDLTFGNGKAIFFPDVWSTEPTPNTPGALSFGRLQSYANLYINGNTDNSGDEYVIITAGHGMSNNTADGLSIGTSTLRWRNTVVSYGSAGNAGQPIYVDGNGLSIAIDWHIGNSGTGEHNANNITYNMIGYYTSNGPATSLGATTNDGAIYTQAYSPSWVGQIAQDYRNGGLYVRSRNDGTWTSWKRVVDASNMAQFFYDLYWTDGATGGPTLRANVGGGIRSATIPVATSSVSGVVTTGNQTFAGIKTFQNSIHLYNGAYDANLKINFGDGDYVYLREPWDDGLEIKANEIRIATTSHGVYIGGTENLGVEPTNTEKLYVNGNSAITGHLSVGGYNHTGHWLSTQGFICNDWVRTLNKTGWYNETYGGGIYMNDSTWVRIYNNKGLYANGDIRMEKALSTLWIKDSNTAVDTWSAIQFGNYQNDSAAAIFLNGPSRTNDGGPNLLTIRNAVGDLRLDDNVTVTGQLWGAVWNDYAEYRQAKDQKNIEPGRTILENGDDTISISNERLEPGGMIVSDTFGFAIGQIENICETPVAVSGRVLAYPYEDRHSYRPGDAVCTGPNGTVSKMTREEIKEYPERIIGIVSAIPEYETWGTNNVKVNGRIWIRVR